jgi:hypothetical protein
VDDQDGAAVQGSALTPRALVLRRAAVGVGLAALLVGGAAAVTAVPVAQPPPRASSTAAAGAVRPLSAAADRSDAFDDWSEGPGEARFLATDDSHTGESALLVTRAPSGAGGPSGYLDQTVAVTSGAPLTLSFWARAASGAVGAVRVRIAGQSSAEVALKGGGYGWTRFSLDYAVPASVHRVDVQIVSQGPTAGTVIDDLAIQGSGSTGVVLLNAGFEGNSADLSLTDTELVLPKGRAALDLVTRRAPTGTLRWTAREQGGAMASGRVAIRSWRAEIPLTRLAAGYYTVTVRASFPGRHAERRTNLVILDPLPAAARLPSSPFGIGLHLEGQPQQTVDRTLAVLAAVGIRYARIDASWGAIETAAGTYAFPAELDHAVAELERLGIRPLLVVAYGNPRYDGGRTPSSPGGIAAYARFAAALAQHYPGADLDLYNEFDFRFNTGTCGRTPSCYLQLLRPAAAAVRQAAPATRIAAPSVTGIGIDQPWLTGFVQGGGLGSTDVVAVHPYVQPAAPEPLRDQVLALRSLLDANGGTATPVWFTEYGYSTVPGWITEQQQAAYLARSNGIALAAGVGRIYWYDAVDDSPMRLDLESNFGLFRRPDSFAPAALVPKPGLAAEATAIRALAGAGASSADLGRGVQQVSAGSGAVRMYWSTGRPARLRVGPTAVVVSATGARVRPDAVGTVPVGASPIYVWGAAPGDLVR